MPRPAAENDDILIARLSGVFRDVGYEGASLARLADAAGLKRASLYHRFPGGKEEMAKAVLAAAGEWLGGNIVAPLMSDLRPEERIAIVAANLDAFYRGGRCACLLNLLSSPHMTKGPFADDIKQAFRLLTDSFAHVSADAGHNKKDAAQRSQRTVMLLHGALVLSRGTGSTAPFKSFLRSLPDELLF